MRNKCWLLALGCWLLAVGCLQAQPLPAPMKPGRTPEGVVYFLPKTVLHFHLLLEQQTFTPGEFARYAERYLHRTDIAQEPQSTYSISDITIRQSAVRDTSKCFNVRLKGGKSETAEIHLSDDGILLSVNAKPITADSSCPFAVTQKQKANNKQPTDNDVYRYLPPEILTAGSAAKKAELTAQLIFELQERRQQLITGEAEDLPQDEQQLRYMVSEIDHQHQALMTLFTGSTRHDTTAHMLTLCPEHEMKREVLFRLSQRLGLVDKDDLAGIPYYITIEDPNHTDTLKYTIPDGKKEGGFYVNQPGTIRLTLQREDQPLSTHTLPMAQFGFVTLRGGLLFKRYPTRLQLHPTTGAVEYLHAE